METERSGSCLDSKRSKHVKCDRPLSIDADLVIEIGGRHLRLLGAGSQVFLELPSVSTAIKIARMAGSLRSARARLIAISQALTIAGLTVTVRTPKRKLFTMGHEGNSKLLRLIGMPNFKIHAF